jgi:mannose-6-phosphate isomerase-like protein (cupin superfamily)
MDTTVIKIDSSHFPRRKDGLTYLASGVKLAMRRWDEDPSDQVHETERDYEVVGYVLSGRAELHSEGQMVRLEPGDSYVVPRGARHYYRVLERLSVIEATSPPFQVHGRDENND